MTKPQDILVAMKLVLPSGSSSSFAVLAKALGMSASEVHGSVGRLVAARLLEPDSRKVLRRPFIEFIVHGVAYAYPASLGEMTRGVPTAWAAPVLARQVSQNEAETPVWPDPEGSVRGLAVEPLYRSVPHAIRVDPALYDLMALIDAIRLGRARERSIAAKALEQRLNHG